MNTAQMIWEDLAAVHHRIANAESDRVKYIDAAITWGRPPDNDPELLVALYDDLRATGVRFFDRWQLAGLPRRGVLMAGLRDAEKHARNDPHGWAGKIHEGRISYPSPPIGTEVVYVLADDNDTPVYVGHTTRFRLRLGEHIARGRAFTRWAATPGTAADEAVLIHRLKPAGNIVYPRLSVTQSDDAIGPLGRPERVTQSDDT